jgi:hypothetical protein
MQKSLKKLGIASVAGLSLIGATLATSGAADARPFHHGWRGGGWGGPAFVGGLALGALAASGPYYGYGYGYDPGYYAYDDGYYGGDCVLRQRVVHGPYGPVVRHVRVCY